MCANAARLHFPQCFGCSVSKFTRFTFRYIIDCKLSATLVSKAVQRYHQDRRDRDNGVCRGW
jgi:hypothetical protein